MLNRNEIIEVNIKKTIRLKTGLIQEEIPLPNRHLRSVLSNKKEYDLNTST